MEASPCTNPDHTHSVALVHVPLLCENPQGERANSAFEPTFLCNAVSFATGVNLTKQMLTEKLSNYILRSLITD